MYFGRCNKYQRIRATAIGCLQGKRPALICEQGRLRAAGSKPRSRAIAAGRNGKGGQAVGPYCRIVDLHTRGIGATRSDKIRRAVFAENAGRIGNRNTHCVGRRHGAAASAIDIQSPIANISDFAARTGDDHTDGLIAAGDADTADV